MEALVVPAMLLSLFSMVFWMVIGARAVRAHEAIGRGLDNVAAAVREQRRGE